MVSKPHFTGLSTQPWLAWNSSWGPDLSCTHCDPPLSTSIAGIKVSSTTSVPEHPVKRKLRKPVVVAHACNMSIQETEPEGPLRVQDKLMFHAKCQASLGYTMRLCF